MNTQVLGISVDSVDCLKAWAASLGGITYPLLSDFYPHGQVAQAFGVLRAEGKSERAIFVLDKQGVIQYVDVHDIDQQPDNEEIFRVLERLEPQAAQRQTVAAPAPSPEPTADVVMYCTPWCPSCRTAREFLDKHHIQYVTVDISRDRAAAERVRRWANGNETTPTFNVKGTIIVDFDQAKLEQALGLKK
jgi:glutaredoxin